jgi:hypothetical protein
MLTYRIMTSCNLLDGCQCFERMSSGLSQLSPECCSGKRGRWWSFIPAPSLGLWLSFYWNKLKSYFHSLCNILSDCIYLCGMRNSWVTHYRFSGWITQREREATASQCITSRMLCLCLFSTTHCSLLRLIVWPGLDVPTFATRRLHVRAPSGGRWNCGREMSGNFA